MQTKRADHLDNQTVICPLSAHTERADHLWTGCPKRCCRSCFQRQCIWAAHSQIPRQGDTLRPENIDNIYIISFTLNQSVCINIKLSREQINTFTLMKGDKVVEGAEICSNLMMFLFIFRREHLYFCQVICVNCWVACSSTVI